MIDLLSLCCGLVVALAIGGMYKVAQYALWDRRARIAAAKTAALTRHVPGPAITAASEEKTLRWDRVTLETRARRLDEHARLHAPRSRGEAVPTWVQGVPAFLDDDDEPLPLRPMPRKR